MLPNHGGITAAASAETYNSRQPLIVNMQDVIDISLLEKPPQKVQLKRCPYMSHYMHCFAGGFANMDCYDEQFHGMCDFKSKADNKPKSA